MNFLDTPNKFHRSKHSSESDADYANPFKRPSHRTHPGDVAVAFALAMSIIAISVFALAGWLPGAGA